MCSTSKETGTKQEEYRMHFVSKQMGTEWVAMGMGFGYGTGIQQIQNRCRGNGNWTGLKLFICFQSPHLILRITTAYRLVNSYLLVDKRLIII